jgi:alkylhydroperoxidase/carboxymuconolactone decarboxylase family protein YurZ
MTAAESPYAELLRRLALNDSHTVDSLLNGSLHQLDDGLGDKANALVRVAALIASKSAAASYQWAVASALAAGATEAEVAGVLLSVAPIVGVARVAPAALELAIALGYDVDVLGPT